MKKTKTLFLILLALNIFLATSTKSAGPLQVNNGAPVIYTGAFTYRLDEGTLGSLSNSEANAIIEESFAAWQAISTSSLTFQADTPPSLGTDVNETNFDSFIPEEGGTGYSPIVYDSDGELTNALFGSGASASVLAFAGPAASQGNSILDSQIVLNGVFVDGVNSFESPETDIPTFKATVLHEIGHAFGLDHSQINVEALDFSASEEVRESVPLMFPQAVNSLFEIKRDDVASISTLYPTSSFSQSFGTIEGKVLRSDCTTPVQGANVIARRTDDPTNEAVSSISDFLITNDGTYKLSGLTPGAYRIEIEAINSNFTQGSGVGPFSGSSSDPSFVNPVPSGFFTGADQIISTIEGNAKTITIAAGETISDQNIIATTNNISCATSSGSISSSSGGINTSELQITGSESFTLTESGKRNIIPLTITHEDIEFKTMCRVFTEGSVFSKPKNRRSRKFKLSPSMASKEIKIRIPRFEALSIIDIVNSNPEEDFSSEFNVEVLVECNDGESTSFGVSINSPSIFIP